MAAILARVNAHVHFAHAQRHAREQAAAADGSGNDDDDDDALPGADLSLDFLGSVGAEDIQSLLEAEAARAAASESLDAQVVETATATGSEPPTMAMAMAPLAMPSHLLHKRSPPKLYASIPKSALLQPKFVVPPAARSSAAATVAAAAATMTVPVATALEEDAGVAELMDELELELELSDSDHHVVPAPANSRDIHDEHKSEPPPAVVRSSAMDELARSVFLSAPAVAAKNKRRSGSDADNNDNDADDNAVVVAPDPVADEMRGWVTGYRDPDVLRRKETMARRKRRQTTRFGVSSAEEQRTIHRAAKYYAGEDDKSSESASDDSTGSNFSPADDADERDDAASDAELLSDDYLDAEQDTASRAKTPRRGRLRNKHRDSKAAKASTPRSQKATTTTAKTTKKANGSAGGGEQMVSARKATLTVNVSPPGRALSAVSTSRQAKEPRRAVAVPAARRRAPLSDSDSEQEHETIDLLSSDDAVSDAAPATLKKSDSVDSARHTPVDTPVRPPVVVPEPQKQDPLQDTKADDLSSQAPREKDAKAAHLKSLREKLAPVESVSARSTGSQQPPALPTLSANDDASHEPRETSRPDSEATVKVGAADRVEARVVLSEAVLKAHTLRKSESSAAATNAPANAMSAEVPDDVSEADTLAFDDVEEDEATSDEPSHEVESTWHDDLGFSDNDDNDDNDNDAPGRPVVTAPNDDEYEQFFADTPLRKQKLKEQQERQVTAKATYNGGSKQPATTKPTTATAKATDSATKPSGPVPVAPTAAVAVTLEATGSNGLRKKTKPGTIAMSTVMKGKYQLSRRTTKVIVDEGVGSGKRSVSGVYGGSQPVAGGVKKSRFSAPLVQETSASAALTAEFMSFISERSVERGYQRFSKPTSSASSSSSHKQRNGVADERYLSYTSSKTANGDKDSDDEPLSASRSRAQKSSAASNGASSSAASKGWSFSPSVASNENVDSNPVAKAPAFPRDRQIDLYDALHLEARGPETGLTARDLRDGEYKRPSAFKKVQEEKEKRGIAFVPRETYLENLPIPKKKLPHQQPAPPATAAKPSSTSRGSNNSNDYSSKRASSGKPSHAEKPSHYGPSAGPADAFSSPSRSGGGYANAGGKKRKHDKYKSRRSYSPPPARRRADDRFASSSVHGGRGKAGPRRYDRSRSPSPRPKDRYKTTSADAPRKRNRSASRSRSRSRSRDRDERGRSRDWDDRRDRSPLRPVASELSESSRKRARSAERDPLSASQGEPATKKAKPLDPRLARAPVESAAPPPPGALFDDGSGSDLFISDSDNEYEGDGNAAKKPAAVEDIRVDLSSIEVDAHEMKRRVYVTGLNGMMSEEELEELFAPFGIETDRETGFPAIRAYLCQRSHRPRGDACVTFFTEDSALSAVEEINAKIVKNCKVEVRAMTLPTQRLLNAQFHTPREAWKCPGADCRADVSIWNNKCTKCARKRVFGPSRVRVADTDWLCSICFTANADRGVACSTCNASLPPTNRAQFYST
ncbi:hypothetical protein PybrP1_001607 [[Pythium] brassicae (nom. inval.)]|nr:hypothetical protein PybrP1_001607 [[Pythium] brassicae (nom. inval.)]